MHLFEVLGAGLPPASKTGMSSRVHTILGSAVIDGGGMAKRTRQSMALRRITEAMETLKEANVIASFTTEDIYKGQALIDIHYTLTLTDDFVQDASRSLRRAAEMHHDFREVTDCEPTAYIPLDPKRSEKLRGVRGRRKTAALEGKLLTLSLDDKA